MTDRKAVIVVIDDSQTIRKSAQMFLGQAGFEVAAFETGFDGIAALNELRPAMIFLDVMMPGLDGYETCRLIKDHPNCRAIPLVILSSKGGITGLARARMSGADDLLAKPFTKQSLLDTVEKHIHSAAAA
jgi:twitching motility two-component system response regulator PilG